MSEVHIRQIKVALEKNFAGLIDLSDVTEKSAGEQINAFLTRSLCAFALMCFTKVMADEAAQAVTDGYRDNGIDGIYYHPSERILYLIQSKWRHDGSKSINRGDMQKFVKGFKDLINARFDRFNDKIVAKALEIEKALNDASTRILLLVVYTGVQPLALDVGQDLKDVIDEINDSSEIVTAHVLRQSNIYSAVSQGVEGAPINVEVVLYDWGQVREPYVSYYGQVSASDVANWYEAYHNHLFAPNIRMFLGRTDVNTTILDSLIDSPQTFWYFNNGITALCRTIAKKPIGGATRETGIFECHDLRVVNGA